MAKLTKYFQGLLVNICWLNKLMMDLSPLSLTPLKTQKLSKRWNNKNREKPKLKEDKVRVKAKKKIRIKKKKRFINNKYRRSLKKETRFYSLSTLMIPSVTFAELLLSWVERNFMLFQLIMLSKNLKHSNSYLITIIYLFCRLSMDLIIRKWELSNVLKMKTIFHIIILDVVILRLKRLKSGFNF